MSFVSRKRLVLLRLQQRKLSRRPFEILSIIHGYRDHKLLLMSMLMIQSSNARSIIIWLSRNGPSGISVVTLLKVVIDLDQPKTGWLLSAQLKMLVPCSLSYSHGSFQQGVPK